MSNPFFDELDWALRGKQVRVKSKDGDKYSGILNRIDHNRGSVLLHDAARAVPGGPKENWEQVGSVFVRNVATIYSLPKKAATKTIEFPRVTEIEDSPYYPGAVGDPPDAHLRSAYRNGFTGGFPVCRKIRKTETGGSVAGEQVGQETVRYELINGHKRIEACRRVGVERHPVEVIDCTDEQAEELVALAHREDDSDADD